MKKAETMKMFAIVISSLVLINACLPVFCDEGEKETSRDNVKKTITIDYMPGAPFPAPKITEKNDPVLKEKKFTLDDLIKASALIQDFEGNVSLTPWPAKGKLEFATDWKADGKRSVRIYKNTFYAFSELKIKNWTPYQVLRIHTYVPGDKGVEASLEIADHGRGYLNRHQNAGSAPPGESVIDIDISGNLWRGEVNRPYRGSVKKPINKNKIVRMAIGARGGDIYIDKIQLITMAKVATPGGFAFDFGKKGQLSQAQYIEINENTKFTPQKGYGFANSGVWKLGKSTPYPTAMMGNGLEFTGNKFLMNLQMRIANISFLHIPVQFYKSTSRFSIRRHDQPGDAQFKDLNAFTNIMERIHTLFCIECEFSDTLTGHYHINHLILVSNLPVLKFKVRCSRVVVMFLHKSSIKKKFSMCVSGLLLFPEA